MGGIYNPSSGGIASGVAFPLTPSNGQRFFRTDLHLEFYYDNALVKWLSANQFDLSIVVQNNTTPYGGSTFSYAANPYFNVFDLLIEKIAIAVFPQSTTAANYFTMQLKSYVNGVASNVGGVITSQNIPVSEFSQVSVSPNAIVLKNQTAFEIAYVEVGVASSFIAPLIKYRIAI